MTTANTAEINPLLLRIWEKQREISPGGGTDRHLGWCHSTIYQLALDMTDEQKIHLVSQLESQLEVLTKAANG